MVRIACAAVTAPNPSVLGVSLARSTEIEKESDDEPESVCPRLAVFVPALVALSSVANDVDAQQAGQQAPPPPTPPERWARVPRIRPV
jgi:hypothetical protein